MSSGSKPRKIWRAPTAENRVDAWGQNRVQLAAVDAILRSDGDCNDEESSFEIRADGQTKASEASSDQKEGRASSTASKVAVTKTSKARTDVDPTHQDPVQLSIGEDAIFSRNGRADQGGEDELEAEEALLSNPANVDDEAQHTDAHRSHVFASNRNTGKTLGSSKDLGKGARPPSVYRRKHAAKQGTSAYDPSQSRVTEQSSNLQNAKAVWHVRKKSSRSAGSRADNDSMSQPDLLRQNRATRPQSEPGAFSVGTFAASESLTAAETGSAYNEDDSEEEDRVLDDVTDAQTEAPVVATLVPRGDDDVYQAEEIPEDSETKVLLEEEKNRRKKYVRASVICSVVLIGVVGLVVGLVVSRNGSQEATDSPTMSPTPAPTFAKEDQAIVDVLVAASFDGGAALNIRTTPQTAAAHWLLDDPNVTSYSEEQLIQRYALATFMLSSNSAEQFLEQGYGHDCDLSTEFFGCDSAGRINSLAIAQEGKVGGTIPEEIGLLTHMTGILISDGFWEGSLPTSLGALANLVSIEIGGNSIGGTIPTELSSLKNLKTFMVQENELSGSIPTFLAETLGGLVLAANLLTGTIPTELFRYTRLSRLLLSDNLLSGTLSTLMGQLTNLFELLLSYNNLNGSLPTELYQLSQLRELDVGGNSFIGQLPTEIFFLPLMEAVGFYDNEFTGNLPTEIGSASLKSLVLYRNQLTSTIPTELGLLGPTLIEFFDISQNELTGTIPTELGLLSNLVASFVVGQDGLSGTIPTELQSLQEVLFFRIIDTPGITGTVPTELGLMKFVSELFLSGNGLTGSIPESICLLRTEGLLGILEVGCNGALECSCCTDQC